MFPLSYLTNSWTLGNQRKGWMEWPTEHDPQVPDGHGMIDPPISHGFPFLTPSMRDEGISVILGSKIWKMFPRIIWENSESCKLDQLHWSGPSTSFTSSWNSVQISTAWIPATNLISTHQISCQNCGGHQSLAIQARTQPEKKSRISCKIKKCFCWRHCRRLQPNQSVRFIRSMPLTPHPRKNCFLIRGSKGTKLCAVKDQWHCVVEMICKTMAEMVLSHAKSVDQGPMIRGFPKRTRAVCLPL